MSEQITPLRRTCLYEEHKKLNAHFVEFGGWEMPVYYTSIVEEHNAVRNKAGIFDASHMGEFFLSGFGCLEFLNKMATCDIKPVLPGKAKYTLLLNENGGIIDDLIIYRRETDFMLVVNAGNTGKDFKWLSGHLDKGLKLDNQSDSLSLIALQGPESQEILQPLMKTKLAGLKYFNFVKPVFFSMSAGFCLVARTGYTGEDGFEIFISNESAPLVWKRLVDAGAIPCGLGARDTLRLEAGMPLHGHEISDEITPLEAGLDWTISWNNDFIGKDALLRQKAHSPAKFLAGFILETGIPRANCVIMVDGKPAGAVTSGTFSPTLRKGIGVGYIDRKMENGDAVSVLIHGQPRPGKITGRQFYKRPNK